MTLRRKLFLVVGLSAVLYLLIFSLPYPLSQNYSKIPPVDYAKLSNYSATGFIAYLVGLAIIFLLYLWALRLIMHNRDGLSRAVIGLRFVLITGALLAVVLLLSYPLGAIDVLVYAIYTRGWAWRRNGSMRLRRTGRCGRCSRWRPTMPEAAISCCKSLR